MYSTHPGSMSMGAQRKLTEATEKRVNQMTNLAEVLKFVHKHKPASLNYSEEHWIDKRKLDLLLKGFCDKLTIHGYGDRAKRLQYLQSVLEKKWANNLNKYKCMMTLLIDLSDRPCDATDLAVGTRIYSETPEEDEVLSDSDTEETRELERQREKFRLEVVSDLQESRLDVSYSSDSDLSDWQASDEEELTEGQNTRIRTPEVPLLTSPILPRESPKFLEYMNATRDRRQSSVITEIQKREADQRWNVEEMNACNFLQQNVRHVEPVPLTFQPVISTLSMLHTKFGEYWEWKKRAASSNKLQRLIIMENDIIHEILWQFTSPSTKKSVVFTPDWNLKPELVISSLSQTILASIVNKFGRVLSKLVKMRDFIDHVEQHSYGISATGDTIGNSGSNRTPQPQMYQMYAYSLAQILSFVTADVNSIERNLKRSRKEPLTGYHTQPSAVPCTTLIQLDMQLRSCVKTIDVLDSIHTQSIASEDVPNWLKSIKLISCVEAHLRQEKRPRMYGLALYLYSRSLTCILEEMLRLTETTDWRNETSVFQKNNDVKLNDVHFWENIITIQPFEEQLKKLNIEPLSCLKSLLPKFLTVLKVLEMIRQINPDFKLALQGPVPTYKEIVEDFLNEVLSDNIVENMFQHKNNSQSQPDTSDEPNFERHFMFLGLQNSLVANAFEYILDKVDAKTEIEHANKLNLSRFTSIKEIPVKSVGSYLELVLTRSLSPYFKASQSAFKKLFEDYEVEKSMKICREIVFGAREDFALDVIQLSADFEEEAETGRVQEIQSTRNVQYQKLLDQYYPDGRSNFEIKLVLDVRSDTNVRFEIQPNFPLNLVLPPAEINLYLLISHQLHRIRQSLQILNGLRLKECKAINGVTFQRMWLFRYCFIHFCASLRSYVLITLFSKDVRVVPSFDQNFDINEIRTAHGKDLHGNVRRLLSNQIMNSVVLKNIIRCSTFLEQNWTIGIPMVKMVKLEVTLQQNWNTVADWSDTKYPQAMNELSQYFPSTPGIFH